MNRQIRWKCGEPVTGGYGHVHVRGNVGKLYVGVDFKIDFAPHHVIAIALVFGRRLTKG